MRAWLVGAVGLVLGACSPTPIAEEPRGAHTAEVPTAGDGDEVRPPAGHTEPGSDPELERDIATMLARVSKARALPVKSAIAGARLEREAVSKLIMDKTDKELPKGVLEAQGELLRSMGLIATDYDFVSGIYALIQENLAGFYDQHEDKMFILDDLGDEAVAETLAHELVHALQDQHFDLTALLDYKPGQSDRVTAGHALAEGDAMSAMFDLTMGDSRRVTVKQLRIAMVASVALSGSGIKTPRVLQASLIAPYIDGFRFVQALRERGGWDAVNRAYKTLPASTEQLLHVDKYLANEAPIAVDAPMLPSGYAVRDQDVLGEQGLRIVFEQWGTNKAAGGAAEGWGGDKFAIGNRETQSGTSWAAAWSIRFDNASEAAEAAALMRARHPKSCVVRSDLGAFAWRRQDVRLVIVAGPFDKSKDGRVSAPSSGASCVEANQWIARLL